MKQLTTVRQLWSKPTLKLTLCTLGIIAAAMILAAATPLNKGSENSLKKDVRGSHGASTVALSSASNHLAAAEAATGLAQAGVSNFQGSTPPAGNSSATGSSQVPQPAGNNSPVPPVSISPGIVDICSEEPLSPLIAGCRIPCPESPISCWPCRLPIDMSPDIPCLEAN